MKKLLVLLLVLGLASVANAAPIVNPGPGIPGIIFTVDGQPQLPEYDLKVCEVLELDVELDQGHNSSGIGLGYLLVNSETGAPVMTEAEFITDGSYEGTTVMGWPAPFALKGFDMPPTQNNVQWGVSNVSGVVDGYAIVMNQLYVHCLEAYVDVDVLISITSTTYVDGVWQPDGAYAMGNHETIDYGQYQYPYVHMVRIHQIPEPMTLTLLSLGGLALIRRRKA